MLFFFNIIQIGNYSFNHWSTAKFYTTIKQDVIEVKVLFKRRCFRPADTVLIFSSLSESHSYETNEFNLKLKYGQMWKLCHLWTTSKIKHTELLSFTLSKTENWVVQRRKKPDKLCEKRKKINYPARAWSLRPLKFSHNVKLIPKPLSLAELLLQHRWKYTKSKLSRINNISI